MALSITAVAENLEKINNEKFLNKNQIQIQY